ncbi:response regulator transcription factor [Chloroflexota bacterium]
MKVLIIEDDPEIIEVLSLTIDMRLPGVELVSSHLGEKGVELAESERPDVVILDLGLPDINGFDVLKKIRTFSDVPILILTARGEETDVVRGLEWGADDYIVKPFRQMELLSRMRALTRRASPSGKETPLIYGELSFDPSARQLFCGKKEINLTRTEGIIIHNLMKYAGNIVTHSILAEAIWGDDYPDATNAIKVYILRLRQKLEANPSKPKLILTKTGIGYSLVKPD